MKRYVLGLVFDENNIQRVVLKYMKNKKDNFYFMNYTYNGIGGEIKDNDSPLKTIVKKSKEDLEFVTNEENWRFFCTIESKEHNYKVYCYSYLMNTEEFNKFRFTDSLDVITLEVPEQLYYNALVEDMRFLIPLAQQEENKHTTILRK